MEFILGLYCVLLSDQHKWDCRVVMSFDSVILVSVVSSLYELIFCLFVCFVCFVFLGISQLCQVHNKNQSYCFAYCCL